MLLLLLLPSQVSALSASDLGEEWSIASATYIKAADESTGNGGGACGYGDTDKMGYGMATTGVSSALFNKGSSCGGCFVVRCVDHILWCLQTSPSIIVTATDFCPPNYGLAGDYGGWCNYPREHLEMSEFAFGKIAELEANIVPVQYRRVNCERKKDGIRFLVSGSFQLYQVLVTNVGSDGQVVGVKVKGSKTGWIPLGRNWGQNWQCNLNLIGQFLSFEVTTRRGNRLTSYDVAPADWQFGQIFQGKQFEL